MNSLHFFRYGGFRFQLRIESALTLVNFSHSIFKVKVIHCFVVTGLTYYNFLPVCWGLIYIQSVWNAKCEIKY